MSEVARKNPAQRPVKARRPMLISVAALAIVGISALIRYDESIGVPLSILILVVPVALLDWKGNRLAAILGFTIFAIAKILLFFSLDPITGPDATRYYAQLETYASIASFYNHAITDLRQSGVFEASSYTVFGLLYLPFYKILGLTEARSISLFNASFALIAVYLWDRTNFLWFSEKLGEKQAKKMSGIATFTLFASPALSYWSSVFLKDVLSLSLAIIAFYSVTRKRWIIAIFFIIFATALRPYAVVAFFIYWIIYSGRLKLAMVVAAGAAGYVLSAAGPVGLANSFPMMTRILVVPNPSSVANWEQLLWPTLEAFFIIPLLILVVLNFLLRPDSRRFYITFAIVLFIYACTLTLVGYGAILSRELEYGLGSAGDDMFRKKLPFVPVIYTMVAYTLATLAPSRKATALTDRDVLLQ